jgi:hypothetical protein
LFFGLSNISLSAAYLVKKAAIQQPAAVVLPAVSSQPDQYNDTEDSDTSTTPTSNLHNFIHMTRKPHRLFKPGDEWSSYGPSTRENVPFSSAKA